MIRLLIFYIAIVIFLTLNPWLRPDSSSAIGFLTWDMIAHAGAYGTLAIVLMLASIRRGKGLTITALVIISCGLSGVLMEYCQFWFTTSRQMSLHDAVANFMGAILGACAFWGVRMFATHTKQRPVAR